VVTVAQRKGGVPLLAERHKCDLTLLPETMQSFFLAAKAGKVKLDFRGLVCLISMAYLE
jgi:hypothetical protein